MAESFDPRRRTALKAGLLGAGVLISAVGEAQQRMCSPLAAQPEGPFYPVNDQPDKDNDLILVRGKTQAAKGQVILVQGTVTDQHCRPVQGVLVEIWQACSSGKYNHPNDPNTAPLDPNFQYWGKALSDQNGNYQFRTIVPGAYPADTDWIRPPHIHFKVQKLGYMELITQMYFAGNTYNAQDKILSRLPKSEQAKVVIPLQQASYRSEYPVAKFNISIEKIGG